jgi:hypothetical protein
MESPTKLQPKLLPNIKPENRIIQPGVKKRRLTNAIISVRRLALIFEYKNPLMEAQRPG